MWPHPVAFCARRRSFAGFIASVLLVATASAARSEAPLIAPEKMQWMPSSSFEKDDKKEKPKKRPRMNLSGAACVPTTPKFTSCLIANDEKKYAQFFSIDGTTLSPQKLIRLSDEEKDPDAEGVAYASGYFYVTGSHGRSRHGDEANDSSYVVFRFPVDPVTGVPPFKVTEKKVAKEVESSTRLRKVIQDACVARDKQSGDCSIRDLYDESLADGGVNIEGIAVKDGRMHFGLRGPSRGGNAYLLSVDAEAMFKKHADLKSKATSLALGKNTGIRDLAAVSDGILVLAGPTREEDVPYAVWLWDGVGNNARQLARLDLTGIGGKGKAEVLLPLAEDGSNIRMLVMFDGIKNGGAVSFKIPR
jgi:hypothetical protein